MGGNRKHGFDEWGLDYHYLESNKYNEAKKK